MDNYTNPEELVRFTLWLYILHKFVLDEKSSYDKFRKMSKEEFCKKCYPETWKKWLEFEKNYPYKGYL